MNRTSLNLRLPLLGALLIAIWGGRMNAQVAFNAPDGGWNYIYEGDSASYAADGEGFASLDGTWSHDNGSDQWDGSEIGGDFGDGNRPGGAMIITEGDTSYLRIQDTGDPRDYGFSDPASNRKVYLGHSLTEDDGASETQLDDGVTLIFRARVPNSGPLDVLHPDGQAAAGTREYPEGGDGYVTSDGGKGNFVIKQAAGGAIAFSLTTSTDTPGGDPNNGVTNFSGLSMNEFAGNAISGDVNFGQGDGANVVAFDPTEWHEFWITIQKDDAGVGTHLASIYIDGNTTPQVFKMTAGPGSDFDGSYLAMGATATPQNAALDIDFFGVKFGAVPPVPKSFKTPEGGWNYAYEGSEGTYAAEGEGFASLDGTWSHDNGSDQWDGSGLGGEFGDGNRPGGAEIITEGSIDFLRIQDTGDPRDYGFSDPASNRKVYLGHSLTEEGASETVIDDGVTLSFRARVPTGGGLDVLHPDGQADNGTRPYPEGGDGYVTSDGGKGNFVIRQSAGGAIAFSLTTATDTPGGDPTNGVTNFSGLSMNEFAGNAVSGDVNFGQGDGANVIPFDPTQWHEFWITIEKDEAGVGTHIASIYIDGNTTPQVFKMTAGPGSDFDGSYISMGATATPQNAALDIDFYRIKFGSVPPEGASASPPPNFSDVSPAIGAGFVDANSGVTFIATSEGSIPRENIQVILNGQDLSANLEITGNEQSWNVKLTGLQENSIYDGTLVITDSNGIPISGILSFNTFSVDNLTFEAENFNFDNGEFIDNAVVQGGNSYFDKGGGTDSEGVDFHELSDEFDFDGNPDAWRFPLAGNMPNTVVNNNEAERAGYTDFPDLDFSVDETQVDEWLNYTRTFSVGDANVYVRSTGGGAYAIQLDRVTSNAGAADQTTETLGWFRSSGARGGNYEWIVLRDSDGAIASVDLSGEVTLRATIVEGGPDLNFFMVTPAVEVIAPPPVVAPEPVTPTVSITRNADGTVTVEFVGVLQSALSVDGPYVDVAAESPLTLPPAEMMQFARARQP